MRLLAPFRALRPPPELAPVIATPPYDVVSSSEARDMASGNPRSFFRISRPEVGLRPDIDVIVAQGCLGDAPLRSDDLGGLVTS